MNVTPSPDTVWIESSAQEKFTSFFTALRRHLWLSFIVAIFCIVVSLLLAFLLPSYWRVEIVVMPVAKGNGVNIGSALAGGLGSLGGLGSIGALLGRPSANQDEALAVLRSRELFDTYAQRNNLLPALYADDWDSANGRWTVTGVHIPTLRRAYKLFDTQIRDIDLDRRTGIITMSLTWKDRAEAAKWARGLIDLTNSRLRQHALQEAQRNMNFLSEELRRAGTQNAQNALVATLASSYDREVQNYMSAKGDSDFAFQVIDAPTIPDDHERVFPNRPLFAALGVLLGVLFGIAAAWLVEWRSNRGRQLRPARMTP